MNYAQSIEKLEKLQNAKKPHAKSAKTNNSQSTGNDSENVITLKNHMPKLTKPPFGTFGTFGTLKTSEIGKNQSVLQFFYRHNRRNIDPSLIAEQITPEERSALPALDHDRQRLVIEAAALRVHRDRLTEQQTEPQTSPARCFECTHRYTQNNRYQCHQRPDVSLWHPRGGIDCNQWEARP